MKSDLRQHVSRETFERLECYVALLEKWNPKINLVSPRTLPDVWTRHIQDSLQIAEVAGGAFETWTDLGSGGGFPGAVIAILSAETVPGAQFSLIEADQRKSAFLRTVARETGVPMSIISERIELAPPQSADVVSARALAPLPTLLDYVHRHLTPSGRAFLPKGRNAKAEVTAALEGWRFDCKTHTSQTDAEAVILEIGEIERV